VGDPECSVPRPVKELKGFKKVFLKKGEAQTVTIELDKSAFSFWDPETKKWTLEPGKFNILVGSSSRDIRLNDTITL
jgi:beta-glucosidase